MGDCIQGNRGTSDRMRARARGSVCLIAWVAAAQPAAQSAVPAAPWPRGLVSMVQLPAGAETDAARLRAWSAVGIRGVLYGDAQDPKLARESGFVLGRTDLGGNDILRVPEPQFARLRADYERDRDPAALQRPRCLSAPATEGELSWRVTTAVESLPVPSPCALVLGHEVSTTLRAEPLDLSFSPAALSEFRVWLRARYGDLGALERAWQMSVSSFDDVVPFTVDQILARGFALGDQQLPASLAPWSDHRSFMDFVLERTVRAQVSSVRAKTGSACGLTGIQPPSAFGGHDLTRLVPILDLFEVAEVGGARALAMSFARPGARQFAALPAPTRDQALECVAGQVADALAHGMSGVFVDGRALLLDESRGLRSSAYGTAVGTALAWAEPLGALAGASLERSSVWIVESQASVQAHWLLDVAGAGGAWLARSAAAAAKQSTSLAARTSWVRMLEDLGLQPEFVADRHLVTRLGQGRPKLLVFGACLAVSDATVAAVQAYVQRGGVVVADGMLGYYDEHLRRRARPAFDGMCGLAPRQVPTRAQILVRGGEPIAEGRLVSGVAASERGVEAVVCERAADGPGVQCEQRVGRGTAMYLNVAVCEYDAVRLDPTRVAVARDLRRRVQRVLDVAGVVPPVAVRGRGLPTCIERMVLRGASGRQFVAVRVNALSHPTILQTLAKQEVRVEVQFAAPIHVRRVGHEAYEGPRAQFEFPLDPWRGLFLEIDER